MMRRSFWEAQGYYKAARGYHGKSRPVAFWQTLLDLLRGQK